MPYPSGARSVQYSISAGANPTVDIVMTGTFGGASDRETGHAAIEAGANAALASIRDTYPELRLSHYRSYDATIGSDPWPADESEVES